MDYLSFDTHCRISTSTVDNHRVVSIIIKDKQLVRKYATTRSLSYEMVIEKKQS